MRHHETQNVKFTWRKLDFLPAHRDNPAHEIDAEIASVKHWLFAFLLQPMPLRHADTREELINTERLRDIIVSAEIERRDLGAFVVTARQDYNRQGPSAIADLLDDIEAIHIGQTEVEDKEIGGGGDDIALAFQARAQKANNRRLVVDNENAQRSRARRHGRVPGGARVGGGGDDIAWLSRLARRKRTIAGSSSTMRTRSGPARGVMAGSRAASPWRRPERKRLA